jgi:hypothetical protein
MEDAIYRHLEPALAFQLELNRLRNFDLESVPTTNHSIHLYFASAKKVRIIVVLHECNHLRMITISLIINR